MYHVSLLTDTRQNSLQSSNIPYTECGQIHNNFVKFYDLNEIHLT